MFFLPTETSNFDGWKYVNITIYLTYLTNNNVNNFMHPVGFVSDFLTYLEMDGYGSDGRIPQ